MKHLIAYGIGGILTTAVNYLIYAGFLGLNFHYLAANTLAWAGAAGSSVAMTHDEVSADQIAEGLHRMHVHKL